MLGSHIYYTNSIVISSSASTTNADAHVAIAKAGMRIAIPKIKSEM